MKFGAKQFINIFRALVLLLALTVFASAQTTGTDFRYYASGELDLSTQTTYDIYTTLSNLPSNYRNFQTVIVTVIMTDLNNAPIPATFSIGTNASSYNNIIATSTSGSTLLKIKLFPLSGDAEEIPGNTTIKLKVVSACAAILGTPTCKAVVRLVGTEDFPPI